VCKVANFTDLRQHALVYSHLRLDSAFETFPSLVRLVIQAIKVIAVVVRLTWNEWSRREWLYLDLRMLLQEREVTISLVAIVARLFMHGCHAGRYLRWKQLPNANKLSEMVTALCMIYA
jgi:hypothetical protein